jgi:hypothetical protein
LKIQRKNRLIKLKKGYEKYKNDVRKNNPEADFSNLPFYVFRQKSSLRSKPEYSDTIKYFLKNKESFGNNEYEFDSNVFEIPVVFSIIEAYEESMLFLRKLFNALHYQTHEKIYIDYKDCKSIDICASLCMDIILADFIKFYNQCNQGNHKLKIQSVNPINFQRYEIEKILFSIGAYSSIKGMNIQYDNIIPFPIIVGNKENPKLAERREVDITRTVDYIINCLNKLGKTLTGPAESNFYKVIGEVIQNAEEHSNTKLRYLIGHFEETQTGKNDYGIFNLAILNFGNTYYETFKIAENPNTKVIDQMKELSSKFTKKGLFSSKRFEEETLWTLYALQDGVTRLKDWNRGNGALRFIEKFFNLRGNSPDDLSKMVITSGHTRIIFDGTYSISKQTRGNEKIVFNMMTFNESGNIEELPDENYVKYEQNYFPGTIISVKLKLDYENTENFVANG